MVWKPHPKQHEFMSVKAYECMFGGTKGPGKTEAILVESLKQTHLSGYRGLILRRTFPRLGEVIDRSHRYFKEIATFSGHDKQLQLPAWTFQTGAKIAFGHCQNEFDKYNFQGKEFHFIAFDQVEEFTETQYLFIMAQNRTSNPELCCYIRSTANPGGIGHGWVKKRFIDCLEPGQTKWFKRVDDEDTECSESDRSGISRCFIPASVYDNPSLTDNDPNYVRRLEQLPELDKQALLHGNWEVFKGQYFRMWSRQRHVKEWQYRKELKSFISLDYGYANPSAVYWWQIDEKSLRCYRELYGENLTYDVIGEKIRQLSGTESIEYIVADPAIWGDKTHHKGEVSGESGAETLQKAVGKEWTLVRKANNNRITGWNRFRILLDNDLISYDPSCVNAIRTIPILIHDEKKVEDVNTDGEDHAGDSTRYGVMSRPEPFVIEKPVPVIGTMPAFEKMAADYKESQEQVEEELYG